MGQCQSCFTETKSSILGYKNINLSKKLTLKRKTHDAENGHLNQNGHTKPPTDGNYLNPAIPKLQLTSPGQTNFSLDMDHLEESELTLESKYSDLIIPPTITLSNFLINEFKKIGDKEAMIDPLRERTFSYPNLLTQSRNVCAAILTYDLKQGDGVVLVLPSCCELVCLFVGIVGAGGTAIFINPEQNDDEIEYQMSQSLPKFMFIDQKYEKRMRPIAEKNASIQQVFCLFGESDYCLPYDKFMQEADKSIIARTKLSVEPKTDIAAIFFTNGRTSPSHKPKGVMLSHYNILANLYQIRVMYDIHSNDHILNMYPMHTAYGFVIATLYSLIQGSAIYLIPNLENPTLFTQTIETHKISHIYLTPTVAQFLATDPAMAKCNTERLKEIIFGSDAPNAELISIIKSKYRYLKDIRFSYAMTELSPLSHVTPPKTTRVGSFGVLLPNTLCKIIGVDSKELLGPMRKGQMCIKGPQVFVGYLNNEAETAKILAADGWLYTDDVVYYDKEMHFFYVSPLEEYIKMKQEAAAQPNAQGQAGDQTKI